MPIDPAELRRAARAYRWRGELDPSTLTLLDAIVMARGGRRPEPRGRARDLMHAAIGGILSTLILMLVFAPPIAALFVR